MLNSTISTHWRTLAAILICLNIAGVLGTSWWHLVNAGETPAAVNEVARFDAQDAQDTTASEAGPAQTSPSHDRNRVQSKIVAKLESDPNALNAEVLPPSKSGGDAALISDQAASTVIPEDYPSFVPPEADEEMLKDDAVFQEIRKLFSSDDEQLLRAEGALSESNWNAAQRDGAASSDNGTALRILDIERETQRVAYAARLAEVAQAMLADARAELSAGNTKQASEVHGMATSLRIMAAKLLKSE